MRWDDFSGELKRVFNYGDAMQDITIGTLPNSSTLWYVVADAERRLHQIGIPKLLRAQQWCYVAAVSGTNWMRLYFDGALVAKFRLPF